MSNQTKLSAGFIVLILLTLACGTFNIGIVETPAENPGAVAAEQTPVSGGIAPTETAPQPTEEPDFSYLWTEYRDPVYGYGVALPAHWVVNPTLPGGGAMTTASYDEAYFMAHSTKGWWTDNVIPEGAIKMDFAGLPDQYPDLDLAAAIREMLGSDDLTVVVSTESKIYNGHEAVLVTMARPDHLDETVASVAFRLPASSDILLITPYWGDAFHSPDVQAILNSFTIMGEAVTLPKIAPNPPLSDEAESSNTSGTTAIAWVGHVLSMPEGSQYDDFVLLSPPGAGEFGISGSTPEIEAEIRFLRDGEGPDEYVHFWGQLNCGVEDYNQCQLVVDKIQREGYAEGQTEGWIGTIVGSTFNSANSHVFQLSGDVPMWYSIHASQDSTMQARIESLRDTGAIVQVWGTLMIGIPDVNGSRIEPTRLEILQEGQLEQPPQSEGIDLIEGWQTYTNDRFGYSFKYPSGAAIEEHGVESLPTGEIPEGMTPDLYQEQLQKLYPRLCIGIRYSLGYLYISAPPNAEAKYSPCGPTGVGSGEITSKTEEVTIGGQLLIAEGMEFVGDPSTSNSHLEMFSVTLDGGTRIRYGGGSTENATYQDYLAKTKEILLRIMSTYQPTVKRVYPSVGGEPGSMTGRVACEPGFFGALAEMVDVLTYNLEIGNYAPFSYSMGNPFVIGYWRSEGVSMERGQALAMLQNGIFPQAGEVTFTQDETQFPTLDGTPLSSIWGPDLEIAANLYSTGWGPNGEGEAILTIASCADGTYYWHGMLYAPGGFD